MSEPTRGAYYLCLAPHAEASAFHRLFRLIGEISDVLNAATFMPHITLIGDIEQYGIASLAAEQIARNLSPFDITLGALASWKMPWQTLLFQVDKSAYLIAARLAAEEALKVQGSWTPHLSIAYGDLSAEMVAQLTTMVRNRVKEPISFRVRTIELWYAGADVPIKEWGIREVFYLPS